ncbi:uncharacterized protein LOC117342041 isoform X2 [Pecten maximus]|uniref:uncharacterized protein LOC117342041 isoform X2 n=1 Tax=Pecten maximus TaxID=6579 RepID=UPI001458BB64|nr:uncharacterized protein LOC117342041 isoform X2 [Pecten maximus]
MVGPVLSPGFLVTTSLSTLKVIMMKKVKPKFQNAFLSDYEWAKGIFIEKSKPDTQTQTDKDTTSQMGSSAMVICFSGMNHNEEKNIIKFCCKRKIQYSHSFSQDITHVVMKTDPVGSRMCDRSLKFFKGICKNCWVLDYQWILDSVSSGHLLPEEDFEVIGDMVTNKIHYGPRKSRLTESPLLKGYEVFCFGKANYISKGDLEDLVTGCGGSLLDPAKQLTSDSRKLAVACVDELFNYDQTQVTSIKKGLKTVSHDWLLDSITVYKVQNLDEYLITDKKVQNGETDEMDVGVYEDNSDVDPHYQPISDEYLITDKKGQNGETDEMDVGVYEDNSDVDPHYQPISDEYLITDKKGQNGETDEMDVGVYEDNSDVDPHYQPISDEYLITDKKGQNGETDEMDVGVYEDNSDVDPEYQPISDVEDQSTDAEEVYLEREAQVITGLKGKKRKRRDKSNNHSDFEGQDEKRNRDGKRNSMVDIVSDSDSDANSEVFPILNGIQEKKKQKSDINVQMAHNNGKKRKWDKQHYCMYCGKGSTNIRKHYFSKKHISESQVQRVMSFPLHSKERTLALEELRNAGDYKHNYEVIKSGEGVLVPWRNVTEETAASEMLPCEYCLAFFMKTELWRHHAVCKFRKTSDRKKYRKVSGKATHLLPCEIEVSEGFKTTILAKMSGDQVSLVSRNDGIITKLGEKLFNKHGHLEHMHNYIGQKMREMARLLICIREEDSEITTIEDLIDPKHFPLALRCTQKLCGYEEETNTYRNPSLALKLGYSLKKCGSIKKANGLIEENEEKRKKAEDFIAVHELMWPNDISSAALTTLKAGKWNKPSPLPLTEDVSKLQKFVKEKLKDLSASLSDGIENSNPERNVYSQLSEIALIKLVMFNRRRGGEAERLTIEAYQQKSGNNAPIKDIEDSLTPVEKKMCSLFQRVEIRGKKGRKVPVLLTKDLIEAIDLLLKAREKVGVSKDNPFIFARMNYGSNKAIRASDALRKYAKMSGVEKIENITSTKLRKHIATVSQIMNLGSTDLEQLATFMGHDIEIHRSFYRLPESTIQVAKLGKFLLALDSGDVSKYSSCTLDDVTLNDDDVAVDDEEDGEDMEEASDSDPGDSDSSEQVASGSSSTTQSKPSHSIGKGRLILNAEQITCLKQLFKDNIVMRKELKLKDCTNAIAKEECLNGLDWKKVKNTVHNWIMNEKKKTKALIKKH